VQIRSSTCNCSNGTAPNWASRCALCTYADDVTGQREGWQTFGEKTIYNNRWVRLGLVDVRAPNGERWDYHVVHLDRIAVALIVDDQNRVLMLWRYRFVTEQWGMSCWGVWWMRGNCQVNHDHD
jgi:hypothetical protein